MRTGRWCVKRILITKQCGNCSTNLCTAIAEVIKKLCAADNLLTSIEASLAWHLVPLDKNHGLHPIVIEEILHQIAGKVIVTHITQQIFVSHFEKKKLKTRTFLFKLSSFWLVRITRLLGSLGISLRHFILTWKLTSHGTLLYLWSVGLWKSFYQLIVSTFTFLNQ